MFVWSNTLYRFKSSVLCLSPFNGLSRVLASLYHGSTLLVPRTEGRTCTSDFTLEPSLCTMDIIIKLTKFKQNYGNPKSHKRAFLLPSGPFSSVLFQVSNLKLTSHILMSADLSLISEARTVDAPSLNSINNLLLLLFYHHGRRGQVP